MDEFLVWWPLLLLLYKIYVLFRLLNKKFMKKSKNINLEDFFRPKSVGRFTGFGLGLSVIPTSKMVLSTGLPFLPVFTETEFKIQI
jgi:hypothetical protein